MATAKKQQAQVKTGKQGGAHFLEDAALPLSDGSPQGELNRNQDVAAALNGEGTAFDEGSGALLDPTKPSATAVVTEGEEQPSGFFAVSSPAGRFHRGGLAFGPTPVVIDASKLTKQQFDRIMTEPRLSVKTAQAPSDGAGILDSVKDAVAGGAQKVADALKSNS